MAYQQPMQQPVPMKPSPKTQNIVNIVCAVAFGIIIIGAVVGVVIYIKNKNGGGSTDPSGNDQSGSTYTAPPVAVQAPPSKPTQPPSSHVHNTQQSALPSRGRRRGTRSVAPSFQPNQLPVDETSRVQSLFPNMNSTMAQAEIARSGIMRQTQDFQRHYKNAVLHNPARHEQMEPVIALKGIDTAFRHVQDAYNMQVQDAASRNINPTGQNMVFDVQPYHAMAIEGNPAIAG